MLPNLFTTLTSQSRFSGRSLAAVVSGQSGDQFVIAPSDAKRPDAKALQCGLLDAFAGFFDRGFRAHDYQLGRRNCQKFLMHHFRLPILNPIVHAGFSKLDAAGRTAVLAKFVNSYPSQENTLPIIPLCGTAAMEVPEPSRATITTARLGYVLNWIVDRLHAIAKALIASAITSDIERWRARSALDTLISTWGKAKLKEVLQTELKDVIAG
jgi:hypothetical protein